MSGTIIQTPSLGASDWSLWITQQERTDRGFMQVSLTNFAATTASSIATGSVMECAGSIYQFTETAITLATGTASSSTAVYYVIIPSAGGTTVTVVMDSTAPTWVDAKQGFYASAASISRVIGGCYIGTALVYYRKWLYEETGLSNLRRYGDGNVEALSALTIIGALSAGSIMTAGALTAGSIVTAGGIAAGTSNTMLKTKVLEMGDWNMDASTNISVAHGLGADWLKIRSINFLIRRDDDTYRYSTPCTTGNAEIQVITDATNTVLSRRTDGAYDNTDFDSTSYNRGWITIIYEA